MSKRKVIKSGGGADARRFGFPNIEEYKRQQEGGGDGTPAGEKSGAERSKTSVEGATAEAERILLEAEEQREAIRKQAFEQGYSEGIAKAKEEEARELTEVIEEFRRSLVKLAHMREEVLKESELDIVDLSLDVARKVISAELHNDPDTVTKVIRGALKRVKVSESMVVRVNPEDHAHIVAGPPDFLAAVKLVADSEVERGGAVIEGPGGKLDAQIEEQLAEIEKSLKKDVVGAGGDKG